MLPTLEVGLSRRIPIVNLTASITCNLACLGVSLNFNLFQSKYGFEQIERYRKADLKISSKSYPKLLTFDEVLQRSEHQISLMVCDTIPS